MKLKLALIFKIIFLAFLTLIVILEGIILYGGRNNFCPKAGYIIVLGAKLHGDRPSKSLLNRMNAALGYMRQYPHMKLIATGGRGSDELIEEAAAIKKYFMENGIPESRIILEDKSENTFENLKFARELIPEKGTVKANIVTNNYHILRAKILAERNGFKAYGVPAKTPKKVLVKSYFREALALVKSYVFDR